MGPHLVAPQTPLKIAVIGSGISGLAAAWLLSERHDVTLYEAEDRLGGHANTVGAPSPQGEIAVDTGFIVYNEPNYPNLTALFRHFDVPTLAAPMSFAVSLDAGAFEYSTHGARALFAQPRNLFSPKFWAMLRDVRRFHRTAPIDLPALEHSLASLGAYLAERGYCEAFRHAHLLPQAAAIWSSSVAQMASYPAAAFIRFYKNHRLLEIDMKPNWRTVQGGSRTYVRRLAEAFRGRTVTGDPVVHVIRSASDTRVVRQSGQSESYDQVLLATHSDQALALLDQPTPDERRLLGAIAYQPNLAVLHRDASLMPRRRAAWAAWNYLGHSRDGEGAGGVTYWMNRLQGLPGPPLFVSLNPTTPPRPETVIRSEVYEHPVFDGTALAAQRELWSLQGVRRTWFCGAWFGSGFHEDGLQAGLAAAEALGGVRRPWSVENESGRIVVTAPDDEERAA